MKNSRLLTIFVIVFVDLLGFSLILPLLPYYAETYGATPVVVGLLVASYAAAQLVGAPLLGRLSDRHGRRPVLLLSVTGTLGGFLLLAFADPLGRMLSTFFAPQAANQLILSLLFMSRIIDGLTGGILGITTSIEAITRVVAPSVGGYLLQGLGIWVLGIFSAALLAWTVIFAYRRIISPARRERLITETEAANA
jgi:DHA1 family tetracycline resistance protein-like MFS transporter